ncbi:MAG: creatininase family protein, partial [Methylococcales bacterium]|nr:creatininase family protein [Methylococcales bacterium]
LLLQPKRYLSVFVFIGIVFPAIYLNQKNISTVTMPEQVFIEDMTWIEVDQAIKSGTDTLLIPTGGTEQNGPHMVLGKHNYIVKYTAGKIAEQLGNALVAPVLSYVPEGNIDQPEGHMRFSGTLSVTDDVFAKTLELATRSMRQHGFKVIAFIGDSGGNQAMQQVVADKLNEEWQGESVRVIQVGDYYQRNGQLGYLLRHGFSMNLIGGHAGIRDSSELLAVKPMGIRNNQLIDYSNSVFSEVGADGDPGKASVVLGHYLLDLKVDAAIRQIQREVSK